MEHFYTMANVQATLFIYMAVGYGARKGGLITAQLRKGVSDLLVYILLPCMVFNSFQSGMSLEQVGTGAVVLAVAFLLSLLAWVVGWLCWHRFPPERAKILRYGTLIANSGFAGLAVIEGAYGAEGLLLAAIFIIANRVLMWTAGISLFQTDGKKSWVKSVLFNPGIVAVFLGLAWTLLSLPMPSFCSSAIAGMGGCTAPVSMIVVGATLADVEWRGVFEPVVLLASGVRLVILPALALIILRVVDFDPLATAVAAILTGMPVGSTTSILAEKYGADAMLGSKCIFVSTLLSLFTIPVLTLFL